jgi:hypothetical protein
VALVGLAPVEQRAEIAQAAAAWMGRAANDLPQAGQYTARQRAILREWKRALEGYAAGRPGSLGRVRAASRANAVLYADALVLSSQAGEGRGLRIATMGEPPKPTAGVPSRAQNPAKRPGGAEK